MDTPKKIGRYEILEELGQGAMGTVYRAKDPAMDRVVAVKTIISLMLASEQGTEFRERFYREARAAGALAHPGIVPVFDVGEHEGMPFLVMEFISGKTLEAAVKKGERMTLDRACELGQKVADALGYAHKRGVVHRDIKPANILLTSKEAYGIERPKITDFGVAKLAAGHTTMMGQMLGTPAFMPPEQFTGAPVDGRADLFSLGVVLYWLATGEQPFPGESMTAVSYKVVHMEPVPPRKLNPSIPVKLEAIIQKCLAKSPDERYQTGEDLARDLGEFRTVTTATTLQSVPAPAATASDPNATYVETHRAVQPVAKSPVAQALESRAPAKGNPIKFLAIAAVVIVVVSGSGWYAFRNKEAVAVQANQPAPAAAPAPSAPSAPPSEAAPVENLSKPAPPTAELSSAPVSPAPKATAPAKVVPAAPKKTDTTASAVAAPKPEPVTPEPQPVDFNPRQLDPKASAKLKIEADHVPPGIDFTVEMNGKVYLRRSAEGGRSDFDDFYVPPGVQEFRVTAGNGSSRKISNTVSAEFKARKKHTLKIELRTQGISPGAGIPQDLYNDTQIVLTLK